MAGDYNEVTAAEIGSAVLSGAKNAVGKKIGEPLSQLVEPGDMKLQHPIDDVSRKLVDVSDRVGQLMEARDMNPKHMPQFSNVVDATSVVVNKKIETIKAAGSAEGTKLVTEFIVGAAIDRINPSKNLELADKALDAATGVEKIRHVEGHLFDGKGLAVPNEVESTQTGIAKFKQQAAGLKNKALDIVEKVPVLGDVVSPDLDTRIAKAQHDLRPTTEDILRAKHLGKPSDIEQTQAAIKESAEKLRQIAQENPEVAKQINRQLSSQQIRDGIVNNLDQNKLTHGSSSMGNYTPDVAPPNFKDYLPMSARDTAHLVFLPQNPSPQRMERYQQLLNAEYSVSAEKMKMAGVPYAWGSFGGGAAIAAVTVANHVSSNQDAAPNKALSEAFLVAANRGNEQGFKELISDHKELKNAADIYQHTQEQLILKGGGLDDADRHALKGVAATMAKQIETQGPASFGEVSKANEQNQQR